MEPIREWKGSIRFKDMFKRLIEKLFKPHDPMEDVDYNIWIYPSHKSCVKHNMSQVKPEQMPPLMVRKAP